MQNYADQILQGIAGDAFQAYQKQAGPAKDAVDLSTGEIRLEEPAWLSEILLKGACAAPRGYIDVQGLSELRQLYAAYLRGQGYSIHAQQVLVTTGAKEALWLSLLAYLKPGETLLLPAPCWFPYRMWGQAFGASIVCYDVEDREPAAALIAAIERYRPAVALLNFPHNPTGVEIAQDDLQCVLHVAAAYGTTVISDEVYRVFALHRRPGSVLTAIAATAPNVIFVDSVTKMLGLAGLRIGFLVADTATARRLGVLRSSIASCVSSFAQGAALSLLDDTHCGQWIQTILTQSHAGRMLVQRQLQATGYRVASSGAIYVWVHQSQNAEEAEDRIVTEGGVLQVAAGRTFGAPGYYRLCAARTPAMLDAAFTAYAT